MKTLNIQNRNTTEPGFNATHSNVQLLDILQIMCLDGASKTIRVISGDRAGTICFAHGEIVHAEFNEIVGKAAFFKIMEWSGASFEPIVNSVPDNPTIEDNWQFLLMEACRQADEDTFSANKDAIEVYLSEKGNDLDCDEVTGKPIRVLIVDDSAMMRKALIVALEDNEFIIAGSAANGADALKLIPQIKPDVITMDINMPVMDGISALKRIMILHPIPTVMVSALTQEGAAVTFDALKFGAVDFISKPSQMNNGDIETQVSDIRNKVRLAAKVAINTVRYIRAGVKGNNAGRLGNAGLKFVASVGVGEGGYGVLLKIIPQLSPDLPVAFVVVLYAAPAHVDAFVRYLGDHSRIAVERAKDGAHLQGGACYLASGQEYVTIGMIEGQPTLQVTPSSFPGRRGSTDILMISLAEKMGKRALGIVLSGASVDGAEGMKEIFHGGGTTLIQEPGSCFIKEMAEAALAYCEDAIVVADDKMAAELTRLIRAKKAFEA